MRGRLALAIIVVLAASAGATRPIEVRATCAADVPHGREHTRSLRGELSRVLSGMAASRGYTVDVSLVRLHTTHVDAHVEARAELRGLVSDARGRIRLAASAAVLVRGAPRERDRLQREAVTEAARQLGTRLRAQWHAAK